MTQVFYLLYWQNRVLVFKTSMIQLSGFSQHQGGSYLASFHCFLLGFRAHVQAIKVWFKVSVSLAQIQMMLKTC